MTTFQSAVWGERDRTTLTLYNTVRCWTFGFMLRLVCEGLSESDAGALMY
jgi:hypothetical protein